MDKLITARRFGFGIFTKLMAGFLLIQVFSGAGIFYSYVQMNRLSDFTSKIYNHPLQVTRAVLSADSHIVKIHRSMKDVALARTDVEFESAIAQVNRFEETVYARLDIVGKWILGEEGAALQAETVNLFRAWKPIRDEVILLTQAGKREQAYDIIRGKGATHVDILNRKMGELKDYAAATADDMLKDSRKTKRGISRVIFIAYMLISLVCIIFAIVFARSFKRSIHILVAGIEEFASGNLGYQIRSASRDEIGWLASALNRMGRQRQKTVEELSLQSEILKNMTGGVNLVRVEDGIIVHANPEFEAMFGYGSGELIGKHSAILMLAEDGEYTELMQQINEGLTDQKNWSGELGVVKRDGMVFCCHVSVSAFNHSSFGQVAVYVYTDITERKRLEKELSDHRVNLETEIQNRTAELQTEIVERRESEERFTNLVNTMNSGVAIFKVLNDGASGADYIIQEFNRFALDHEGLLREAVIGRSLKDIRPTIDEYGIIDIFRKVWKTGISEFFPAKIYTDEKYDNYYENRVFRLPGGEIVAIFDDITAQKRIEVKLVESENLLREVINSMEKAIAVYEPINDGEDFIFVELNEFGEKIARVKSEAVVGKSLIDLFPEVAEFGLTSKLKETYLTGKPTTLPLKQYHDNRISQWVENYIFKLPSGMVVAMFEDTFEQKQAEIRIRESEEKYRLLFENTNLYVSVYDREGVCQAINQQVARMFGKQPEECIGKSILELHPEKGLEYIQRNRTVMEKDETLEYSSLVHFPKGNRWLHSITHPISYINGKPTAVQTISHDYTVEKKAEDQIKASLAEKETLLHEIHHRVKNNMQVIISLLNLQAGNLEDSQAREILKDSQNRVYAIAAVHESLHGSESLSAIDLKSYIETIAQAIFQSYAMDSHAVCLNSHIAESPISLNQAYPLGLVVNELISNSLKYAFPGGRTGEIDINAYRYDEEVELVVADNGVGFPEPFDFTRTTTLGLRLVRDIIEKQLNGTVELSQLNGTRFIIHFQLDTTSVS